MQFPDTSVIGFAIAQVVVGVSQLACLFLLPLVKVEFASPEERDIIECFLTRYTKDGNSVAGMCIDKWEDITTLKNFLWGNSSTFEEFTGLYAVVIVWTCVVIIDTAVRTFLSTGNKYIWILTWLSFTNWIVLVGYHWQAQTVKNNVFQSHEASTVTGYTGLGLYPQLALFLARCLLITAQKYNRKFSTVLHRKYK